MIQKIEISGNQLLGGIDQTRLTHEAVEHLSIVFVNLANALVSADVEVVPIVTDTSSRYENKIIEDLL